MKILHNGEGKVPESNVEEMAEMIGKIFSANPLLGLGLLHQVEQNNVVFCVSEEDTSIETAVNEASQIVKSAGKFGVVLKAKGNVYLFDHNTKPENFLKELKKPVEQLELVTDNDEMKMIRVDSRRHEDFDKRSSN